MSKKYPTELTQTYVLLAGDTDAQSRMPMSLIVTRAIEVATDHANALGIGYARLKEHGIGWVLTRLTVDMVRYPRINETYSVTTWIEGYNRLYSDRCYIITGANGETLGHMRSMWVAIDFKTRSAADLSLFEVEAFPISERSCPVPKQRKLRQLTCRRERDYMFGYSDIDFNRHVNTVQYVRQLLNLWSLEFFDHHQISRFAIAFHNECHYGETVQMCVEEPDGGLETACEIIRDGQRMVACEITFEITD